MCYLVPKGSKSNVVLTDYSQIYELPKDATSPKSGGHDYSQIYELPKDATSPKLGGHEFGVTQRPALVTRMMHVHA